MGAIPSREAPTTFFSLRYGTHEVGLIPLTRRYFNNDNEMLRQQFIRTRNDPSVRYHFMREPKYSMKSLPPADYSEEQLDELLDAIDRTLYDTTDAMLADKDAPLRPVPCAICFVYVNGREGSDCFSFYGRRINIIGYFSCRENEIGEDTAPFLHFRKAILKAAGDRTLERVVALCGTVLKEEFFRAVARTRPTEDPLELFRRRITRIPVVVSTLWNSYPTLKFLYDSCALSWAIDPLKIADDPPSFDVYEVPESGEKGLKITLSGPLVLRMIMWVSNLLNPSAMRGSWEQLVLDERRTQLKGKTVSKWLETSPYTKSFMGTEEFTAYVGKHLATLLSEIVRARETPSDDLTLWRPEQEYSHDGKLYRVFDSPLCGPFLTTVKTRPPVEKKNASNADRKGTYVPNTQQIHNDDANGQNRSPTNNLQTLPFHNGHPSRLPPQYEDVINVRAPAPFMTPLNPVVGPQTLTAPANLSSASTIVPGPLLMMIPPDKLLNSTQGSSQTAPTTYMPFFQHPEGSHSMPLQAPGLPFVVLGQNPPAEAMIMNARGGVCGGANDSQTSVQFFGQNANVTNSHLGMGGIKLVGALQPQQMSNYVMLPDGRVGMLNTGVATHPGYWS